MVLLPMHSRHIAMANTMRGWKTRKIRLKIEQKEKGTKIYNLDILTLEERLPLSDPFHIFLQDIWQGKLMPPISGV
jgi:hypothetical protein